MVNIWPSRQISVWLFYKLRDGWSEKRQRNKLVRGNMMTQSQVSLAPCPLFYSCPISYSINYMWLFKLKCVCVCVLSCIWLFASPGTVAHQSPLSIEFSRQEYWSRSRFPTLGDLPNPGTRPMSFVSPALAGGYFTTVPPKKPKSKFKSV